MCSRSGFSISINYTSSDFLYSTKHCQCMNNFVGRQKINKDHWFLSHEDTILQWKIIFITSLNDLLLQVNAPMVLCLQIVKHISLNRSLFTSYDFLVLVQKILVKYCVHTSKQYFNLYIINVDCSCYIQVAPNEETTKLFAHQIPLNLFFQLTI